MLDREVFRELAREIGEEAAAEIHSVFALETEARLKLLRELSIETERTRIGREAHSLKSSAGTFGYRALAGLALRLERDAVRLAEASIAHCWIRWMRPMHRPRRWNCRAEDPAGLRPYFYGVAFSYTDNIKRR